VDIDR